MPKLALIDMEYSSLDFRGIDLCMFVLGDTVPGSEQEFGVGFTEEDGQIKMILMYYLQEYLVMHPEFRRSLGDSSGIWIDNEAEIMEGQLKKHVL